MTEAFNNLDNLDSIHCDEFFRIRSIIFELLNSRIPSLLIDDDSKERNTESLKSNVQNESPVNPNYSTISLLIVPFSLLFYVSTKTFNRSPEL